MAADPHQRHATVPGLQRDTRSFLHGRSHFPLRDFPAGTVIVKQVERGDEAFIVVSGECRVSKMVEGRRHELRTLGPGVAFGETAIISENIRTATVEAVQDVTARIVTRALVQEQLGVNSWLGQFVLALAERFREADEKVARLLTVSQQDAEHP